MNIRTLVFAALFATILTGSGVCQGKRNSEPAEVTPQRVVGLQYPRLAHLGDVQGRVELNALVSSDGTVKDIRVVSGHALLVDAARDSLRRWRFTGCTSTSVQCVARVVFVFVLEIGPCEIDQCPSELQVDLPDTVTIKSRHARAIVN